MTQQEVIQKFMAKLSTQGYDGSDAGEKMLDAAVRACSTYKSIQEAINAFIDECSSTANATNFLAACGITLGNDDVGAITGSDAGGTKTKTAESVVPETGNKYTAGTSVAQNINTGSNDWIVKATDSNDTITSGGADSIDAGDGNDKIIVNANHATIKTGDGSDEVTIASGVKNVTLTDLTSNDKITLNGTFEIGDAKLSSGVLTIVDSTGSRTIKIADLANAKSAKINNQTITDWLTNAGYANLPASATVESSEDSANVIGDIVENSNLFVSESIETEGRIAIEGNFKPKTSTSNGRVATDLKAQAYTGSTSVSVNLDSATTVNSTSGYFLQNGSFTTSAASSAVTIGTVSTEFSEISDFNARGLTVHLKGRATSSSLSSYEELTLDNLTDDERNILSALYKWWMKEGLKLIEESYGYAFSGDDASVYDIDLYFYNGGASDNSLALVSNSYSTGKIASALELAINMDYYSGISATDVEGTSKKDGAGYLDRTLAHEFTHAVMAANINNFNSLPQFIKEGMAELTHGIDDERGGRISTLAGSSSNLESAVSLTNTSTGNADCYAGGYMFLRWLAKKGAEGGTPLGEATTTQSVSTSSYSISSTTGKQVVTISRSSGSSVTGATENVTVNGGSGSDTVTGIDGAYYIDGGSGADVINASLGNNVTLKGGAGNDTIDGGSTLHAYSYVEGGAGADVIKFSGEGTTINAGDGDNTIATGYGHIVTKMQITTGSGNDSVEAAVSNSTIKTGGGADTFDEIYSNQSYNYVDLGDGNDQIDGLMGSHYTVHGGAGSDVIYIVNYSNSSGVDLNLGRTNIVYGDAGDDEIYVGDTRYSDATKVYYNTVNGGAGSDTIYLNNSANSVVDYFDGDGNDIIYGYDSTSTLRIRKGTLKGSAIEGSNVVFTIGSGKVTLVGAKDKTINVKLSLGSVLSKTFEDEVFDGSEDTVVPGGDDEDNPGLLIEGTNTKKKETLVGTAADDTLVGDKGVDVYQGNGGKDVFVYASGGGKDIIEDYTPGDDIISITGAAISKVATVKNSENLVFTVGKGNITVNDAKGKAITIIDKDGNKTTHAYGTSDITIDDNSGSTINAAIDAAVRNIYASSRSTDVNLIGNTSANSIFGGSGDDTLNGGKGNDTLVASYGDDVLIGGAGKDVFVYSGGADYITDYVTGQDVIKLNSSSISRAQLDSDNKLIYLTMGNGSVVTVNGAVNKKKKATKITVIDSSGNQTSRTYGENVLTIGNSDGTYMEATPEVEVMNASSRKASICLVGNSLANTLKGGKGSDIIYGGYGSDLLTGGSGNDVFLFAGGNDTITDYSVAKGNYDSIELAGLTLDTYTIDGKNAILTFKNSGGTSLNSETTSLTILNARSKYVTVESEEVYLRDVRETIFAAADESETFDAILLGDSDVVTIDASKKKTAVNIYANSNDNLIKGTAKAETLSGRSGSDTLTGGKGNDLFIYSSGNDTITDYAAGQDTVQVNSALLSVALETEGKGKNKDLIFTTSNGTLNLKSTKGKKITITDVNGNTTSQIYNTAKISVANTDGATIDASNVLNKDILATVDASKRSADNPIYIKGNSLAKDVLSGGKGNDTVVAYGGESNILNGNAGDDYLDATGGTNNTLAGGAGNDILIGSTGTDVFNPGAGNDIITLAATHTKATITYTGGEDVVTNFKLDDVLNVAKGITITTDAPTDDGTKYTLTFKKGSKTLGTLDVTGTEAFETGSSSTTKKKVTTTNYFVTIGGKNAIYDTSTSTSADKAFQERIEEELFADDVIESVDDLNSVVNENPDSAAISVDYTSPIVADTNSLVLDNVNTSLTKNKKK